tara:strand:+ start:475 stop:621 length:147 start_codon:yes stop_codon:yes gene_type:complete
MKDQIAAVKGGAQRFVNPGFLPVEFNDPFAGDILVGRIEKHIFQFKWV